ncbi:hypothetical protein R6Q59_018482 [Mikania micrantha]
MPPTPLAEPITIASTCLSVDASACEWRCGSLARWGCRGAMGGDGAVPAPLPSRLNGSDFITILNGSDLYSDIWFYSDVVFFAKQTIYHIEINAFCPSFLPDAIEFSFCKIRETLMS